MPFSSPAYQHYQDREALNNPEKWYVRYLWLKYAEERRKKASKDFIKFLTLPGAECFDIRLFKQQGLLKTTATGFDPEHVAFCERDPERYARIGNLLPQARRFNGSYETLMGVGTSGFTRTADRWFPFDVINLDFSGPGFNQPGSSTSRTADAILKTFKLQKSKRSAFSLFITLAANPVWNDVTGKRQLEQCLKSNLTAGSHPEFAKEFITRYPKALAIGSPTYQNMQYHEFLLVTVPKLIIKYGSEEWFLVICQEKVAYIGEGHSTRMVTFCFECEFIGLPAGYGGNPRSRQLASGYETNTLNALKKQETDVNRLFSLDGGLKKTYCDIRDNARTLYDKNI
jgi:hypothetical protein